MQAVSAMPKVNGFLSRSEIISFLNKLPKSNPDTKQYPPSEICLKISSRSTLKPIQAKSQPRLTAAIRRLRMIQSEKNKNV
ncbi:MAG: hypothetical protein WCY32_11850, partial [Burkholderiaceae bacterium]